MQTLTKDDRGNLVDADPNQRFERTHVLPGQPDDLLFNAVKLKQLSERLHVFASLGPEYGNYLQKLASRILQQVQEQCNGNGS